MTRKAVAKKDEAAVPALASMYEEDAGAGFEEADRDAYAIPFLSILQSGSPQCKKSEGAYIQGAQEGMLYNNVSNEVYDADKEPCYLIPCHYSRSFVEWQPRESGGGFVAQHSAEDGVELLKQCDKIDGRDILPNGNQLVDTRNHFCLFQAGARDPEPVVLSFSSTQMKKSRKWMTIMDNLRMKRADGSVFKPPMFSHRYHVTTVPESNDKGTWMGWKLEVDALVAQPDVYSMAKGLRDAVRAGEARAAEPASDNAHTADVEEF